MNSYGDGGGGGSGMGLGSLGNDSNNTPQYNTYGFSPQILDALGISGPLTSRVFVANLDYKVVTPQKLEEVFKLAGRVVKIDLKRDDEGNSKGHGTIEMGHPVEAVQAISMFNGQKFYDRTISVSMDKKQLNEADDKRLSGKKLCNLRSSESSSADLTKLSNLRSYESISADLTSLLDDETFSDVVLKCEDKSYKAHRNILSARSPKFAAMFQHDILENISGFIVIQDMTAETFSDFLRYIYSGKLASLSEDTAPFLYKAADKYGIEILKKDCAKYMTSILSINNVCDFLVLSDACFDEEFKKEIVNFLIKEASHIFKEELWCKFQKEHPILAVDVYDAYKDVPMEVILGKVS